LSTCFLANLSEILMIVVMKAKYEKIVILDNIRSTHNVGSIFRTADAVGMDRIYLCGTTPTPIDRFGRERKDIAKVSLGGEKSVSWEYAEDPIRIVKKLKKEGYQIIALEQAENSIDYKKFKTKSRIALVLGNEVDGVDRKILKLADAIVEIPMKGKKESLNVGVSFGVAAFRLLGV